MSHWPTRWSHVSFMMWHSSCSFVILIPFEEFCIYNANAPVAMFATANFFVNSLQKWAIMHFMFSQLVKFFINLYSIFNASMNSLLSVLFLQSSKTSSKSACKLSTIRSITLRMTSFAKGLSENLYFLSSEWERVSCACVKTTPEKLVMISSTIVSSISPRPNK